MGKQGNLKAIRRIGARILTPRPARGPKIIQRGDVVRPAPGVVLNPSNPGRLDIGPPPEVVPPFDPPAGRARISTFLLRRLPWWAVQGWRS